MPEAARLNDASRVPADSHGCPCCAHDAVGPATKGSPDVTINGRAAIRVTDTGVHSACCGPQTWKAVAGAPAVQFNGLPAHRKHDDDEHCGGMGKMIEGSPDVIIGNAVMGSGAPSAWASAELDPSPLG